MTAKEYLEQIRAIETKVRILKDEAIAIKSLLGVQAISYDRVGSNPNIAEGDKVLSLTLKLIDKQTELMNETFRLYDKRDEVLQKVYQTNDANTIYLLYKRYFQYKKWREIADEMSYTERAIMGLHSEALNRLQAVLESEQ